MVERHGLKTLTFENRAMALGLADDVRSAPSLRPQLDPPGGDRVQVPGGMLRAAEARGGEDHLVIRLAYVDRRPVQAAGIAHPDEGILEEAVHCLSQGERLAVYTAGERVGHENGSPLWRSMVAFFA